MVGFVKNLFGSRARGYHLPNNFLLWGKFYLPKAVAMQVIGVVEGISCLCEQLLLMTCEDKQVYDEDELHLVASSTKQFNSIQFNFIYIAPNHNKSRLKALHRYREKPNNHMTPYEQALWQQWEGKTPF
uniref:Uncharacterized protein n=1 Tax=Maylandia zebra TaxID=106582 RepID=A0A3P9CBS0_9CICH